MVMGKSRNVRLWACIPALQPGRPGRHSRTWFVPRHRAAERRIIHGTIQAVVGEVLVAIWTDRVAMLPPHSDALSRPADLVGLYPTVRSCRGTAVRVLVCCVFRRQKDCDSVRSVSSQAEVSPHALTLSS